MAPHATFRLLSIATAITLLLLPSVTHGRTDPEKKKGRGQSEKKEEAPSPQRIPTNVYENLRNKVSGIDFFTSNYGIIGLDIQRNQAGGFWPRGTSNAYIFGGGIWFGARKPARDENGDIIQAWDGADSLNKLSIISYNPNSGASWMVPGRIGPDVKNSPVDNSSDAINKYRIYYSTDYNAQTGEPFDQNDIAQGGPNWPIMDTHPEDTLKSSGYLGEYVDNVTMRTTETFPKGPAIISGEDIFTTFKDTDLSRYEIARLLAEERGYPIGIQVEQTDYTWGFGDYANFMFIKYLLINRSNETLHDCWMAPALDMDIAQAGNDHTKIAIANAVDDSLNLAVQWSEAETRRFGYVGVDFLESPAIDGEGFLRHDKRVYASDEQLGLMTFRNWTIQNDPKTDESRYDFMSDRSRDGDTGPGDKRFLMATGPFNLRPGDTARIVVGIMFAYGNGNTPNGTWPDMARLVQLDRFAQQVYDNSFALISEPGSVEPADVDRAAGLRLGRSYPLPVGPAVGTTTATVEYSLAGSADVSLVLFDGRGSEVERRQLGLMLAGDHVARIDVAMLPAGLYRYELRTATGGAVRGEVVVLR